MSRSAVLFSALTLLYISTGIIFSWNLALSILIMGLLSSIMALGVNIQLGYAGLFNTGIMGFTALGGLAVVLVSAQPVVAGWNAGGPGILAGLLLGAATLALTIFIWNRMATGRVRILITIIILIIGFILFRTVIDPAIIAVETNDPASYGNLGGLGLPSLLAWPVGGLLAAVAAWAIGKTALGLRSDYLAIATLGIAEIIVAVMRNEDWLARGVKNIDELPRPWPVPYEVVLQKDPSFIDWALRWGFDTVTSSTIIVKLCYVVMFSLVLLPLIWLSERALHSPWGRMMRAIRDNEVAASAMGKNVTKRHLQIFILGSSIVGIAGAMMTSMEGQLIPGAYNPLRFTFLIWVMAIVGGSGNNWGSVLGGLLISWLWLIVESLGPGLMIILTNGIPDGWLKTHLVESAPHMRLLTLGVILLVVLRFSPRGLIPEK
ncbi:MAG: branched-chain amino acid ABC transporter permease [Rhodobacteraceae bacterium]|nr:branched-chain amino acid ABC transporter permease [Paracoccaceae bacterium]